MYKKIDPALRMTANEASARYPDSFILMQMDSMSLSADVGTALFIGDDRNELYDVIISLNRSLCGIVDGLNHQRSLGGVVVGG